MQPKTVALGFVEIAGTGVVVVDAIFGQAMAEIPRVAVSNL